MPVEARTIDLSSPALSLLPSSLSVGEGAVVTSRGNDRAFEAIVPSLSGTLLGMVG
jgi:hypothetical protein